MTTRGSFRGGQSPLPSTPSLQVLLTFFLHNVPPQSTVTESHKHLNFPAGDIEILNNEWPTHYGTLYDMGVIAFEQLFEKQKGLLEIFGDSKELKDGNWKELACIKKIILALQQLLSDAVILYGNKNAEKEEHAVFVNTLKELGGLHRFVCPLMDPNTFQALFELLPGVIVDVTSLRRKQGALTEEQKESLMRTWTTICTLMANHVHIGWDRNVIPTHSKYRKVYQDKFPQAASLTNMLPAHPPGAVPHQDDQDIESVSMSHVVLYSPRIQ